MKPRSAKAKGGKFEKEVVAWLKSIGIEARRQPGSGIYQDFPHDGQCEIAGRRCILEMKKRASLPRTFEKWIGAADILVMAPNRAPPSEYRIYMRGAFAAWLLGQVKNAD